MTDFLVPNGVWSFEAAQVRFKGHSKWQNIKHIKAANDLRIGRLCNKYAHLIGGAIRENGMEKNPEYNRKILKYFFYRPSSRLVYIIKL